MHKRFSENERLLAAKSFKEKKSTETDPNLLYTLLILKCINITLRKFNAFLQCFSRNVEITQVGFHK